jgi:hypothetical protein
MHGNEILDPDRGPWGYLPHASDEADESGTQEIV